MNLERLSTLLNLVHVPDAAVVGIYRVGGKANKLPARMRWLHPEAAERFIALTTETPIVVSDMFRSPESSLRAIQEKRGALRPGYSGHGYGFSIDIDVDACVKKGKLSKFALDHVMSKHGWYCHRRNSRRGFEDWHYDCDVQGQLLANVRKGDKSMAPARERMIQHFYGKMWQLNARETQVCLANLGLYGGAIDGKLGPLSQHGLRAFQRTWKLPETGEADARTKRILWFVVACTGLSQ